MQSLTELLSQSEGDSAQYRFGCQVQKCSQRMTKSQKPYYELQLVDSSKSTSLKVWSNHPQFDQALALKPGQFLAVEGTFSQSKYGLESADWKWEPLSDSEQQELLLGDPALKALQQQDYSDIESYIAEVQDPRLKAVAEHFLQSFGDRFRRAAAARKNHHARRGGLVEHVAQMMRSARAIGTAYQQLNTDLIVVAVLFHDSGKLWENNYPESDFHQVHSLHAEALGHICLGIELVNKIWRDCVNDPNNDSWKALTPSTEHVRVHLLHLIASHHGNLEFGSPVVPKTPEAFALHYIDNLDAKIEMCNMSYETSPKASPQIYEKMFPLPSSLIEPLGKMKG